jgi:hypothetical protein
MTGVWIAVALAAPAELPVALEPFPGRSVAVGPQGEVHVVGMRAGLLRRLASGSEGPTNLVYLQLTGGEWTEEPIPPPSSYGETWSGNQFEDAAVAVDADGWPLLVFTEDWQPSASEHLTAIYLARRGPGGWKTVELDGYAGQLDGVGLSVHEDGWTVAGMFSSGEWHGIVRWEPGEGAVMWARTSRLASELALVEGSAGRQAVYRVLDDVFLVGPDGESQKIATRSARQVSAVARGEELHWLRYDPGQERPYGGVLRSAGEKVEASLDKKEAGWNNTAAVGPDGRVLAAWYYRRNAFNKGLTVAELDEEGKWQSWVQLRDEDRNVGLLPTLAVGADGTLALAALDRSAHRLEVHTFSSVEQARQAAVPPAGDWTDRYRRVDLFTYGGGWLQSWMATTGAPEEAEYDEDVRPMDGTLLLEPALGLQGGLAGRIGRFDLALEYLKREGGHLKETVDKLENLAGKVGIDKFPFPGSRAQVHFHSVEMSGAYRRGPGRLVSAELSERDLQIRYLGKGDWYVGLGYRVIRAPQDVYRVKMGRGKAPDTVLASWNTDGRLGTTSVIVGRSIIDYLGRYEIGYVGPYMDVQLGAGLVAGRFEVRDDTLRGSALSCNGRADLGLVAYRRFRSWRGVGFFAQAGLRGDGTLTGVPPGEAGETELVFRRRDGRIGPFLNLGAVF